MNGAQHCLRRLVLAVIRDLGVTEFDLLRRLAAIGYAPRIQNDLQVFRKELTEVFRLQWRRLVAAGRLFGTKGALVGDDEIDVPAEAQRAIADQAVHCGNIVRLRAESVIVEHRHRLVRDGWRVEPLQRRIFLRHP